MKQIKIIILLIFISISANAQVTLENSYSYSGTMFELDENVYKYFVMDVPMNQCRIYNEDHSLYKTIKLTIPSGYYLNDIKLISTRLFNNDDKIELLYIYQKETLTNSIYVTSYGMKIINEDGTSLLSLSDGGYAEIKEGTDGPRLLAYQYMWNSSYYLVNTKVYTLGGATKTALNYIEKQALVYPNPAHGSIQLQMPENMGAKHITIHDLSGRTVENKNNLNSQQDISIKTDHLPAGTYIIKIEGSNGQIISEQFVKI